MLDWPSLWFSGKSSWLQIQRYGFDSQRRTKWPRSPLCHYEHRLVSFEIRSSSCGRQTVDQFVLVSGLPLGPLTRIYLVLLFAFYSYYILFPTAFSLTRKRVCSLQCLHSLVRPLTTNNHTLPSHSRLCSLSVASYDSRDYGGSILTRLHTGKSSACVYVFSLCYVWVETLRRANLPSEGLYQTYLN
jgi:hypothetical protein